MGLEPALEDGIIRQPICGSITISIADPDEPIAISTPQAIESTGLHTFNYRNSDAASFFAGVFATRPWHICGTHGKFAVVKGQICNRYDAGGTGEARS